MQHDWVKSTLGHGETMCRLCGITNREAAVLNRLNECDAGRADPTPGEKTDDRIPLKESVATTVRILQANGWADDDIETALAYGIAFDAMRRTVDPSLPLDSPKDYQAAGEAVSAMISRIRRKALDALGIQSAGN